MHDGNMKEHLFGALEQGLQQAGFRVLDGDHDCFYVEGEDTGRGFQVTVQELECED